MTDKSRPKYYLVERQALGDYGQKYGSTLAEINEMLASASGMDEYVIIKGVEVPVSIRVEVEGGLAGLRIPVDTLHQLKQARSDARIESWALGFDAALNILGLLNAVKWDTTIKEQS